MGFLREIVRATRTLLDDPAYAEGLAVRRRPPPPSLRASIEHHRERGALLAEFKRRSPGAPDPDLPRRSPTEFVRGLAGADLAGFSCVATEAMFRGKPSDVAELAAATAQPVLFKDFIIDPRQVEAAHRAGASAILLIARLETEGLLEVPLRSLAVRAHELGLEVVLEWHQDTELNRTANVPADVFGVNVRDLDTLSFRPEVAARTIEAASGHRPLLGMSGVSGAAEAGPLWNAGVDGLLVGTALARSTDPARLLESLLRPPLGGAA